MIEIIYISSGTWCVVGWPPVLYTDVVRNLRRYLTCRNHWILQIRLIYCAIKGLRGHSTIGDKARPGCPRSSLTPGLIKAVRERIRRNPLHKQKIMSRELNDSIRTMSRIIRDDLHMKAYRQSIGHHLDARLKKSGMKEQRDFFTGMQLMPMKTSSSQTKKN